jgi:hypothetical protein
MLITLMYVVRGGPTGTRTQAADPVEGPREVGHDSKSQETLGLQLFACRLRLEKFAEHQLATAHSILDTLHLSSC